MSQGTPELLTPRGLELVTADEEEGRGCLSPDNTHRRVFCCAWGKYNCGPTLTHRFGRKNKMMLHLAPLVNEIRGGSRPASLPRAPARVKRIWCSQAIH